MGLGVDVSLRGKTMINKHRRALRRHHRERKIRRTLNYYIVKFWDTPIGDPFIKNQAIRRYNTFTNCSCWLCRNPRNNKMFSHKERLTIQERKFEERFKYEMEEVDEQYNL